jgi:hypothetical protein
MWSAALDSSGVLLSYHVLLLASPITNILISTLKHEHTYLLTLTTGKVFLLNELEKKGHPAKSIEKMLSDCADNNASLDAELLDDSAWTATNFENGQWKQSVCLM